MLTNFRKIIEAKKTELSILKSLRKKHTVELLSLRKEFDTLQEAREIFQKAAVLTQNHLANHTATIVTKALRATFYEKDVYFKVEFVERRNVTECDMWIEENGYQYSLLESRGYGMADISSFFLLVAYIFLHDSENILMIDEPFRNLSEDKHEIVSQVIKELSTELSMQFIIATHVPALREYADKSFQILQDKGISKSY